MDRNRIRYCFLLFSLFVVAFLVVVWLSVFHSETAKPGGCCDQKKSLASLAHELSTLQREFLQRLDNWENEFVNTETTELYHTEILQKLIQKFIKIEEILSLVQNSEALASSGDIASNIKRIIEDFEKHIGKLQTLDSLLMIKLQKKYSQAGMEDSLPSLRFTRLPPGKTWRTFDTKTSIRLHLVFINNYSPEVLYQCVSSVTTSAVYSFLERSVRCLFVLGKPNENPERQKVKKTLEVVKHVRFCKKMIWRVDLENVQVSGSFETWWFIMASIFEKRNLQGTSNTHGFFHQYKGDILFLEDAILSEDVLEVAWFASSVKNTLTDIWQFALGSENGENSVNAHPDTFVVRKAVSFLRNAYGFNASAWRRMSLLKTQFMGQIREQETREWNIHLGKLIAQANQMNAFHVVVPTLARLHVPRNNDISPWSLATRSINTSAATVSKGIRDIYGFLCESNVLVPVDDIGKAECPCISRKWGVKQCRQMVCSIQPFYVQDQCFSGIYLEQDP